MSQGAAEDDGQLHTLGLLEQLRRECSQQWDTSSTLYHRIDGLLRELANPNLHDLSSQMPYRIELWDRHAQHIRWGVAATGTITIGHAASDAAVTSFPDQRLTLRNRALVIRGHVPKGP
jgi:hypothetical protein